MARLGHGAVITRESFQAALNELANSSADIPLIFATAQPVDLQEFDYLFAELLDDPNNLLPVASDTPAKLVSLALSMVDGEIPSPGETGGDSNVPAVYTYLGQFIDHDITLETSSAELKDLFNPAMQPLAVDDIRATLRNIRTATLDLDSIYGMPAPREGKKMRVGKVSPTNSSDIPLKRPPGKTDDNDLPREGRSTVHAHDRAALIGDPRNDENTIVAQLHTAFLLAHNKLVDKNNSFRKSQRRLRQHYQHIVIHDFLKRIADPYIVDNIVENGNHIFDPFAEPFFMPLEFSVAAYRFGHTMVRTAYDFNLNFNRTNQPNPIPATLGLLFTFTALMGDVGFPNPDGTIGFDTLPENWIVEWENLVESGANHNKARRFDTKLVEPLFQLTDVDPTDPIAAKASLAARNLLRGYLLQMPTGQAVARLLQQKLAGVREISVLTAAQLLENAEKTANAGDAPEKTQKFALETGQFLERTPLWYYILAEAAILGDGQHLGPVGSTIVAEVLIGLVRRSEDSILRNKHWKPSLPSETEGSFTLTDLLRFAGVL